MKYGSLFSGIGGFDLGMDRAGMSCAWQAEQDKQCNQVLERHWPDVSRFKDVHDVKQSENTIRPDLIVGGFPCQDLSVAGKRAGLAGNRSGLFFEAMRIIDEFSPRWILLENVPGLLSSNARRDMGIVLGALAKLGYGTAYRIFDAQWFRIAQRRRRVFIVGCAGANWRSAAEVLFERESLPWHPAPQRERNTQIAGTIDAGSGIRRGSGQNPGMLVARPVTCREGQRMQPSQDNYITEPVAYRTSGNSGVTEQGDITAALNCGTDPNQTIIATVCGALQSHSSKHGHAMTTQQAAESGQIIPESMRVRRLMPIECERLQGFPDHHTAHDATGKEISDSARYRMLGNAVCVPVAEWIAKRIKQVSNDNQTEVSDE